MMTSLQAILAFLLMSSVATKYYKFVPTYIDEDDIRRKTLFKTFTACLLTCMSDQHCDYVAFLHDPDWKCSLHCLLIKGPSTDNRHGKLVYKMTEAERVTIMPKEGKEEPEWPAGDYGIVSKKKCPKGWYEFTFCQDTEDSNNADKLAQFTFRVTSSDVGICAQHVTMRLCFKGREIKSRSGGFWTKTGLHGNTFVVQSMRSPCSEFGEDGGNIYIDNEDSTNKNSYGNDGLNRKTFPHYYPKGFLFAGNTRLSFCMIGGAKQGMANDYLEVGRFGRQKFALFCDYDSPKCSTLQSPYGILTGTVQKFTLDDEDSNNKDIAFGNSPVKVGLSRSNWCLCQYDPNSGTSD